MKPRLTTRTATRSPKCTPPKPAPGSQLFGLEAISRYVGLDPEETLRRITTCELPVEYAGKLPIANKAELARIMASAHFNRPR